MLTGRSPVASFAAFDLASRPAVVVAVSGGSDSLALLLLLQEHLRDHAPRARPIAVTVDHGLRSGSADEAQAVARLCAERNIAHQTMRWETGKPATGIAAAAREARYRLLAKAAHDAGTDIVLTGHTADDQVETVRMRRLRGEGIGLAGMAPLTLYDTRVWVARPFLAIRREALRNHLRALGVAWVDDPSNADPRFERTRIRAALTGRAEPTASSIEAEAGERTALSNAAARLIDAHVTRHGAGPIRIDRSMMTPDLRQPAVHALRALLATVGGMAFLAPRPQTENLFDACLGPPFRRTLSRVLVAARRDGVFLAREVRGTPDTADLRDGAIWDGRFRAVSVPGANQMPSEAAGEPHYPADVPVLLADAARATLPRRIDGGFGLPGMRMMPVVAPYRQFLPCFDIDLANALARLVGAADFGNPPWTRHIVTQA